MKQQIGKLGSIFQIGGPAAQPSPIDTRVVFGRRLVFFGFGGFVAWLAIANLSGAVVASGSVVVATDVKKIQHQAGGIVGEIHVRNGQRVNGGDLLVRLNETIPRTTLAQIESQLTNAIARRARLEAERDGRAELRFPEGFAQSGAEAQQAIAGEQRLLSEDRESRSKQADQLRERIGQLDQEIEGLEAQRQAGGKQASLIKRELAAVEGLFQKNLVPMTRLIALQREAARIDGDVGALGASIAKARGQIAELNLQLLALDQKARADAVKDLRDVEGQIAQLTERRVAALDVLARVEVRAPQSGYIHELAVHTVDGVINPGETIMAIVPDTDKLSVEVRVNPQDIDQIHLGQTATLRLSAFNQRTTPELDAKLERIAADVSRDPQTGVYFYVARVAIEENELAKLGKLALVPGMPVEAFIKTGDRTALSYFSKPLKDSFARAFRED
jgi:HlyD family secretion protein